jgi:acyl carrier protein
MTVDFIAAPDLPGLERELLGLVEEHLLDASQARIGPLTRLADAGLDSMAVMQLLLLIEDRFGLWLPEEDLTRENFACIRSLAAAVARRCAERDVGPARRADLDDEVTRRRAERDEIN